MADKRDGEDNALVRNSMLDTAGGVGATKISVLATTTAIAGANAARRSLIVTNLDTGAYMYVLCAGTAVAGTGIVLAPYTAPAQPSSVDIGRLGYTGAVSAIMSTTASGTNNAAVQEV